MLAPLMTSVALALAVATPAAVPVAGACSHDSFTIDGAPLDVQICAPEAERGARAGTVALTETFGSHGSSFSRSVVLEVLPGGDWSRTIDDVPLSKVGIDKSLHLTIGYKPGSVRLEHALLVPGAITLK